MKKKKKQFLGRIESTGAKLLYRSNATFSAQIFPIVVDEIKYETKYTPKDNS
jgi:hypothetical protein